MTTNVSTKYIRTAFANGEFTAPDAALLSLTGHGPNGEGTGNIRGRLHPAAVEAFLAQTPGVSYEEKAVTDEKMVEVPRVKVDAKGRKRNLKPVVLPISEVRALAGVSGKRGRLSKEHIATAGAALLKG